MNVKGMTDKYFTRSLEIMQKDGINPYVRMQVFSRKPGKAGGIGEATGILEGSGLRKNGGHLHAARESDILGPKETMMLIDGYIQDFVELETLYLGVLSERDVSIDAACRNAKAIVEAAEDVPVYYFGARHFPWRLDSDLSGACHEAGMKGCSTDNGARHWGAGGIGTMPHALILSYAAERGGNPTVEAAKAFDRYTDKRVGRTVLVDTFNREIRDALETAEALGDRLHGFRVDTCGENIGQGSEETELPEMGIPEKYLSGRGVKVSSVWALRRALDENGYGDKSIFVSSGFDAEKTREFMKARKAYRELYGTELFSGIGTGSIIPGGKMATADIVQVYKNGRWANHSKAGRCYRPNPGLELVW